MINNPPLIKKNINIKKHFMKNIILLLFISLSLLACTNNGNSEATKSGDFTQYVNPFIGTAFTGHTFPGATYPMGFMQPGPETGNYSWDYCAGYFYDDE